MCFLNTFLSYVVAWYSGYHYCKTSFRKSEFKNCTGSNPAFGVSELCKGDNANDISAFK